MPVLAAPRVVSLQLPLVLAAGTVLLQVGYPLVHGRPRAVLTVLTVAVFFAASVSHAARTRGVGWAAAYVLVSAGTGLAAEAVGTATGAPFGSYTYAGTLGPQLLGVPLVVPLAWAMMAYPCLLVGQRLARRPLAAAALGAVALAGWDLFLDPQMVRAGHWTWTGVHAALPGAPGIPVSNTLGWLAVAFVMLAVLQLLPRVAADDLVPHVLFLWTWAGSIVAFAVFFGRPLTALVGGVGMGLVAVPFARSLRR